MPGFRFIDLFAGIGGFRLAAEQNGGECVFSSELDRHAAETYTRNFGERPHGDITEVHEDEVPAHDVLLAGFPCQPFSICGLKKGFEDTRGTLFLDILRIAAAHNPSCLVLENVKNFKDHDGGNTLATVLGSLTDIGYVVEYAVLNAKNFGMAQSRERTIIVASKDRSFDFGDVNERSSVPVSSILEKSGNFEYLEPSAYTLLPQSIAKTQPRSGLRFVGYRNRNLRKAGVRPNTEHLSRVHKQPNRIYCSSGTHPTLAAGESSGRYWVLHENSVRKLTLKECYRLQGFPDAFQFNASNAAAYKQIGNSVPVPMISEVIASVLRQGLVSVSGEPLHLQAA